MVLVDFFAIGYEKDVFELLREKLSFSLILSEIFALWQM